MTTRCLGYERRAERKHQTEWHRNKNRLALHMRSSKPSFSRTVHLLEALEVAFGVLSDRHRKSWSPVQHHHE